MNQKVEICGIDTATLPRLTEEEIVALLAAVKDEQEGAREAFIIGNMRLVLSVVKRFWNRKGNVDDVFQVGCVGLIKAIDNFDISHNVRFSTYAVPMIVGEIRRYLRDNNSLRVSRSIRDTAYRALQAREQLERESGKEATMESIAVAIDCPLSEVTFALDAISDPVSLYEPIYNQSGDAIMLMDQLGDEKNTEERWTEHVSLSEALSKLTQREKDILSLRYYEGRTQVEVSQSVGISQAQVSRIEKNALSTIRTNISL